MTQQETVHYQDNRVRITNSRAVIDSKTYAMANITSVSMDTRRRNVLWPAFFILVGILLAFTGLALSGDSPGPTLIGFGILLIIVGVAILVLSGTRYMVSISSSAGEVQALTSKDKEYIARIVGAMNKAIIERG